MPGQEDLKPRITVFGVGGAGGNAVNNMIEKELDGVDFVVANTDAQALQQAKAENRVQLGIKVPKGWAQGRAQLSGPPPRKKALSKSLTTLLARTCVSSRLVWAVAQARVPRQSSHKLRVSWAS